MKELTRKEEAGLIKLQNLIEKSPKLNVDELLTMGFPLWTIKEVCKRKGIEIQNLGTYDEVKTTLHFETLSLKELNEYEVPNYSWRIQKILQDKKIIVLSGSSATFKSWLSISIGLSVAKGVNFVENFPTEQGGVLYIDRENSIPELQNRVEMVSKGLGLENEDLPIYFLSEQSFRLDYSETRDYLENFIKNNNIKLIIVDTYRRVVGYEENSADKVTEFFTEGLKPLCEKTGVSFILIHHHKKGKSEGDDKELLRGSSDVVNFVDGILQVKRKGNKLVVTQSKNRSGKEIEPFGLDIETDEEEMFKFNYSGDRMDFSLLSRGVQILTMWFAENKIKEFKTSEAQAICKEAGIKKMKFYECLSELEKRGIIIKTSRGVYTILENKDNPELVHSPLYIESGQMDKLTPSPVSPNGQDGLMDKIEVHKIKGKEYVGDINSWRDEDEV